MTLHIGIASWEAPEMLDRAIKSVQATTTCDYKLLVYDNASTEPGVRHIIEAAATDPRVIPKFATTNSGYVGAVNQIIQWAADEGARDIAYLDQDITIRSSGWNETFVTILDQHHEVAMVTPEAFSSYLLPRAGYKETLWGLGCFWIGSVARFNEMGGWDESLGHQNECDTALRLRLAGWKLAAAPVNVLHEAKATNNPKAQERINNGIIGFVNKWNTYFCGPHVNYYSENVWRWEDWPPIANYLEEYLQQLQQEGRFPILNREVEQVTVDGRTYDLVQHPKYPHLYRDRLI